MGRDLTQSVDVLLATWQAGDEEGLRRLVPLVYNELRQLARYNLRNERSDHTLQSAALVHEAYLRLAKREPMRFENRAHFLAVCAQLMRQILVQHARRRNAAKRNAGCKLTLDETATPAPTQRIDVAALDDALKELAKLDPQQSRIVELRYFGGLSIKETAHVVGVSPATVKRHWMTARVWLQNEISKVGQDDA